MNDCSCRSGDFAKSDRGVRDYPNVPGNRGVTLWRHLVLGFTRSQLGYAGDDIETALYFSFDRECLVDPEPNVLHYEVITES